MYAEIDSINSVGGNRFWGVRIYENKGGKRIGTFNISLSTMKELGVAARQSEKRKLLNWLGSSEGATWLKPRIASPAYTPLGAFLRAEVVKPNLKQQQELNNDTE